MSMNILLTYIWHIFGIYLAYLWHIFGIHLAYIWHIFSINLAMYWLTISLTYLWHIVVISLAYLWHIFGISLVYFWHIFGIYLLERLVMVHSNVGLLRDMGVRRCGGEKESRLDKYNQFNNKYSCLFKYVVHCCCVKDEMVFIKWQLYIF